MKVADVIASVRDGLGAIGPDKPGEGLITGKPDAVVKRVVVCHSPSVAVLRTAAAQPGTLVIAREHPFYLHDDSPWSHNVDTELAAARDPVVVGKQHIIAQGRVPIFRLAGIWDKAKPNAQARALAQQLGWRVGEGGPGRKVVCDIAPQPISALAGYVRDRLGAGHVRITSNQDAIIGRVALMPDLVSLDEARELLATTPAVDGLICAESCEWEAAVYFKDALDISRTAVSVIFAGTQPTMEPGVRAMHEWLAKRLDPLPVAYAEGSRPVRNMEKRG